jgi:hypothetical protein
MLNKIIKCSSCESKKFEIFGVANYNTSILEVFLRCQSCNKEVSWSENAYVILRGGMEVFCVCGGEVFQIKGLIKKIRKEVFLNCILACVDCKKRLNVETNNISIKPMGLFCLSCNKYGEARIWRKNKQGYDVKCVICGKVGFEASS